MYFAQEFIPLNYAIRVSSTIVLAVIDLRSLTMMMRPRIALLGNGGRSEIQPLRGLGETTAFHHRDEATHEVEVDIGYAHKYQEY
jgi:hypothetical protein